MPQWLHTALPKALEPIDSLLMTRMGLVLGVVLLMGCGGSRPRPTPAPEVARCADPDVSLAFAWPETLDAVVVGHDYTRSENADGSRPMVGDSWADLRLVVAPEGAGRTLTFAADGRTRGRSQGLAPDLGGARPTLHLDATGEVVRVDGAAAMRAAVEASVASGSLSREDAAMVLPNTTDDAQLATARAHWNWLLSVWHGQTMSCGVPRRGRATVPALSFGSVMLETETELTYEGHAECGTRALGSGGCVRLVVRQRDVGDAAARALSAMYGPGMTGAFQRTITFIAEPTLVLHNVAVEEHWEMTGPTERGPLTRFIRDVQEYTFDYGAHRPPPTGLGVVVVTRDGVPVTRPDTPRCRWIDACCAQSATQLMTQLICASIPAEGATDCTLEDIDGLRGMVTTMGGGAPPACLAPAP